MLALGALVFCLLASSAPASSCAPETTCDGHGTCVNVTAGSQPCRCDTGFGSSPASPNVFCDVQCPTTDGLVCGGSDKGSCNGDGKCECAPAYQSHECPGGSPSCNLMNCKELDCCNNRGACIKSDLTDQPICQCDDGWGGMQCAKYLCSESCTLKGLGRCKTNTPVTSDNTLEVNSTARCVCQPGWAGEDCQQPSSARRVGVGVFLENFGQISLLDGQFYSGFKLFLVEESRTIDDLPQDIKSSSDKLQDCGAWGSENGFMPGNILQSAQRDKLPSKDAGGDTPIFLNIDRLRAINWYGSPPRNNSFDYLNLTHFGPALNASDASAREETQHLVSGNFWSVEAKFFYRPNLKHWPFEVQQYPIHLRSTASDSHVRFCHLRQFTGMSSWMSLVEGEDVSWDYKVSHSCLPAFRTNYTVRHKFTLEEQCAAASEQTSERQIRSERFSTFSFTVAVSRPVPRMFFKNMLVPLCMNLVVIFSFQLSMEDLLTRISISSGMLMSAVLYAGSLQQQLPGVSIETIADKVMLVTILQCLISFIAGVQLLLWKRDGMQDGKVELLWLIWARAGLFVLPLSYTYLIPSSPTPCDLTAQQHGVPPCSWHPLVGMPIIVACSMLLTVAFTTLPFFFDLKTGKLRRGGGDTVSGEPLLRGQASRASSDVSFDFDERIDGEGDSLTLNPYSAGHEMAELVNERDEERASSRTLHQTDAGAGAKKRKSSVASKARGV